MEYEESKELDLAVLFEDSEVILALSKDRIDSFKDALENMESQSVTSSEFISNAIIGTPFSFAYAGKTIHLIDKDKLNNIFKSN